MRYTVRHTTSYQYNDTVPVCKNILHLRPRDTRWQACAAFDLRIDPEPDYLVERPDYFGNVLHQFSLDQAHRELVVTTNSEVDVQVRPELDVARSPAWDQIVRKVAEQIPNNQNTQPTGQGRAALEPYLLSLASPRVQIGNKLRDYAAKSFAPGRPILAAAQELVSRIFEEFQFDPEATTVHTPTSEVLRLRRGVCQDFAHLAISCLRSVGLPTRYVSGYVRTQPPPGQPRLIGADASHAWFAVYACELGWVEFDPTNNSTPSSEHITVAWGRDYGDVCPIEGVFVGGGSHTVDVAVDVVPEGEPLPEPTEVRQ